jgi:hypothetical protein
MALPSLFPIWSLQKQKPDSGIPMLSTPLKHLATNYKFEIASRDSGDLSVARYGAMKPQAAARRPLAAGIEAVASDPTGEKYLSGHLAT